MTARKRRKVTQGDLNALVKVLRAKHPYDDAPDLWASLVWDWPGQPTPSIIWEGGPEDWPWSDTLRLAAEARGLFVEAYSSYALCVYPAWTGDDL